MRFGYPFSSTVPRNAHTFFSSVTRDNLKALKRLGSENSQVGRTSKEPGELLEQQSASNPARQVLVNVAQRLSFPLALLLVVSPQVVVVDQDADVAIWCQKDGVGCLLASDRCS